MDAAAEELGEGAEEEDDRDEEAGGEGQHVCPHGRGDDHWPGVQTFEEGRGPSGRQPDSEPYIAPQNAKTTKNNQENIKITKGNLVLF